jgi:hypothetical protein
MAPQGGQVMSVLGLLDAMRSDMPAPNRLVWQCLENHANGNRWWPMTLEQIAAELHLSVQIVTRAVKALEEERIIRREFHRRRPTVFHMLRLYGAPDLTHQNEGVKSDREPDLTHQNAGVKAVDVWTLPPKNDVSTVELTHQDSGSLLSTREESTSGSTLRGDATSSPATPAVVVPFDVRKQLWSEGREILRNLTGQTGSAAGRQIGSLLKAANENCAVVLDAMRAAVREEPSGSAIAWITAGIKARLAGDLKFRDPACELAYKRGLLSPEKRQEFTSGLTHDTSAFDREAANA